MRDAKGTESDPAREALRVLDAAVDLCIAAGASHADGMEAIGRMPLPLYAGPRPEKTFGAVDAVMATLRDFASAMAVGPKAEEPPVVLDNDER